MYLQMAYVHVGMIGSRDMQLACSKTYATCLRRPFVIMLFRHLQPMRVQSTSATPALQAAANMLHVEVGVVVSKTQMLLLGICTFGTLLRGCSAFTAGSELHVGLMLALLC